MAGIFLDAGHGGKDSGAVGNGLREKDLTLTIAKYTEEALKAYEGASVKQSRSTDTYLTLAQRTQAANTWKADLFVSIHINAHSDASANGYESFIYNGNVGARTIAFQNVLHERTLAASGMRDRGKKRANFHVVRESAMPAVLTECGFISNRADAEKMKQDSWLRSMGAAHAEAIASFLGLKRKANAPAAPTGELFRVQIGAFSQRNNAETMLEAAKKAGFKDAFITQ